MQWNRCDDELPDDDIVVMVALKDQGEPVWFGYYDSSAGGWYNTDHMRLGCGVTHWAEMPPPPTNVSEQGFTDGSIMDSDLLDVARLHAKAAKIIANAIGEMGHPSLKREDIEGNAVAILARLAHAGILLEDYDERGSVATVAS